MDSGCVLGSIPVSVGRGGGVERIFTFSGEICSGFGAGKSPSKLAMGGNAGVARSFFLSFLLFVVFAAAAPLGR